MEHHRAWYCTYLLFMHIYCFSVQLFTTELQGIATLIILQHSFLMCHILLICAVLERTLIEYKLLIKSNTEPNQSDILPVLLFMWQHLQCLFINSLICSPWTLLVFLFLLPSKEKSLTVSLVFRMALPSGSIRPSWIPRGLWMAGLRALSPPSGVVRAPPELSARRGCPGDRQGTHGDAHLGMPLHAGAAQGLGHREGLVAVQGQAASWDHLSLF